MSKSVWTPEWSFEDIPGFKDFPANIKQTIVKFKSVFAPKLNADRFIKGYEAKLTLIDNPVPHPKCRMPKVPPIHFLEGVNKILDNLIDTGIIEQIDYPTPYLSTGFFVKKNLMVIQTQDLSVITSL